MTNEFEKEIVSEADSVLPEEKPEKKNKWLLWVLLAVLAVLILVPTIMIISTLSVIFVGGIFLAFVVIVCALFGI